MFKKLAITLGVLVASLTLAVSAYASSDLSIRLEQPKSPTNQDTFGITFVAMDINGNALTVTCFKKGPSDGSFSQFGNPITLSNGGNTDNCPVTSSQINTNGTYQFYAIVNNGSETAQSSTVSVDFNTNGPGAPTNYTKSHPDSCTYLIGFTTASDNGETAYVEVYRSTSTSFSLDSSTRVYSVNVGSNTNKTFTDVVPDCNQNYYYQVRAFDNAGNGSGTVGDGGITITNSTTQSSGSSNSGSSNSGNGAIPVGNGNSQVTTPTGAPSEAPTGTTAQPSGSQSVLGAQKAPNMWDQVMNAISTHKGVTALVVIIVALLTGLFFWMKKRNAS